MVTELPSPTLSSETTTQVPTGQPANAAAGCFLGSWKLTNFSSLILPLLVANNLQSAQYTGSSGTMVLSFTADGKMTLTADQYHNLFSGKLGFFTVTADVLIEGSGSGNYTVGQQGNLLLSNPDFSGLDYSVKAASISVIPPTPLTSLVPSLQVDPTKLVFDLGSSCSGDNLTFQSGSSSMQALEFARIK